MRKYFQFFLIALFPYLILFALICMFTGYFMDSVFQNNVFLLLLLLIVVYVIALVCAVASFISSLAKKRKTLDVLHINMIIKLIHIPAYLLIFIVGIFCMITIFTFGVTIVLIILDGMTIALSGLIGFGGVIQSLREKKISVKAAIIHGILQFIYCADVISSIVIYRKVKVIESQNS